MYNPAYLRRPTTTPSRRHPKPRLASRYVEHRSCTTWSFTNQHPKQQAHTDVSMLTILCPERTEGLEIQVNDQWVPVPARPNTLICNIGLAMQKCASAVSCPTCTIPRTG